MFFFNDTATTEIYTLSLHDALPIYPARRPPSGARLLARFSALCQRTNRQSIRALTQSPDTTAAAARDHVTATCRARSEEHTSELQSRQYLVCRLLLEKKNQHDSPHP